MNGTKFATEGDSYFMGKQLNVGLIGYRFMGKAHSNALRTIPMFFDLGAQPVMKVVCGVKADVAVVAKKYGWQTFVTDWKKVVHDPEIDIIAIASPGYTHADIAIAAAENGKHILCEKPLAMTYDEAKMMYEAVQKNKIKHMVNFNYRRMPAVLLAKKLVQSGKLGTIYHFKAVYQQEWAGDPDVPYLWRFDKKLAGAGSVADKGSHIIDLARFLVGEITQVAGMSDIFIKERASLNDPKVKQEVTTDDAAMFITRFENGAMGIFETSRISIGYKNALQFEVNGSKGCVRFNLERLNELEAYFMDEDRSIQGFRNIMVTEPEHEYMDRWWPAGHSIGWEHAFSHQYYEFFKAIVEDYLPQPNFYDGMKNQQVIEAVETAAKEKTWITF